MTFLLLLIAARVGATTNVSGLIISDTNWTVDNSPYVLTGNVTVSPGVTLTLEPGVVVKGKRSSGLLVVEGTLLADGLSGLPIVFTSMADDGYAGDTNGDGNATTPAPNDWYGLQFLSSSTGNVLDHVVLRYAGYNESIGLYVATSDLSFSNGVVEYVSGKGILIDGASATFTTSVIRHNSNGLFARNGARPTITDNVFEDNGDAIVFEATSAAAVMNGNTLSGNGLDGVAVKGGVLLADATWQSDITFVLNNPVTVAEGVTLTLEPGVVIKGRQQSALLTVGGSLRAEGLSSAPIVFTSIADDGYGGDTNGDGSATTPAPTDWYGLQLLSSSTGNVLDNVVLRYAGYSESIGLYVATSDLSFSNGVVEYVSGKGILIDGASATFTTSVIRHNSDGLFARNGARPTITDNVFEDNGDPIVFEATSAAAVMSGNTLIGNGLDGVAVKGGVLSADATWQSDITFVMNNPVTVAEGVTLTLEPGLVIKGRQQSALLTIAGSLRAEGLSSAPIVFTTIADDSYGGDTNGDGNATRPAPYDWYGLRYSSSSTGNVLDHVVLRYAGYSESTGLYVATSDLSLSNGVVEYVSGNGIVIDGASPIITESLIRKNGVGVRVLDASPTIGHTRFESNSGHGVSSSNSEPQLLSNTFVRNDGKGVRNVTPAITITAEDNYWGSAAGPYDSSDDTATGGDYNPNAVGEDVSDHVDYRPWLRSDPNPSSGAVFSGYVFDGATNQPIPNAFVRFGLFGAYTDAMGRYTFENLPANTFGVKVSATGYHTYTTSIDTTGKTTFSFVLFIDPALCPDTATLSGELVDKGTRTPLEGVMVALASGPSVATTGGAYAFDSLAPGTYRINVEFGDYVAYSQLVTVCGNVNWEIPLVRESTTHGLESDAGTINDPVNTATGNYVYQRRDLEIAGIGLSLRFERTYNSRVASASDAVDGSLGYGWSHNYLVMLDIDSLGHATITWGDGSTQTWASDGLGGFIPQYGVFDDLIDDGSGDYMLRKKDRTTYRFDASGTLVAISDRNDNTITLDYTAGELTEISDTAGRLVTLQYDANGHLTVITDPLGRTVRYDYDVDGNLTSATEPNGNVTIYTYDGEYQLLTVVDPRGNTVISNRYDAANRVVTFQTDAKGGATSYSYEPLDRVTTVTDALGYEIVHYHDALLRLVKEVDGNGEVMRYSYDAAGNRVAITDKNGSLTQYTYDARGNVKEKIDALGNVTTITYDAEDNPLSRADALGSVTSFTYDAAGNLLTITDALGGVTTRSFDAQGQLLTLIDPNGNVTTYSYDASGNLITLTDPLGGETNYTYDGVGRRLSEVDPLGRTTRYTYDNNDNVLTVTDAAGGVINHSYDGNDNRTSTTDRNGNFTTFTYDEKDLLIAVTDALGNIERYAYDALDRRTALTDRNGHSTTYAYDAVGNRLSTTDALGKTETATYDANGNRLTVTDRRGNTTTFVYDTLDRLTEITNPLGQTTRTTYDALGRVVDVITAAGQVTSRSYDGLGRVSEVIDPRGGVTRFTYDANGNRLTVTDPRGNTTSYTYDALNRRTQTADALGNTTTLGFDAAGQIIDITDANGHTTNNAYDDLGRLVQVTDAAGNITAYNYDAKGNRLTATDALGRTTTRTYDALDRVISITDPGGATLSRSYDAVGNRLSETDRNGHTTTHGYDALNRRISTTNTLGHTWQTSYDANGNRTAITDPLGNTTTYAYDAANRRTITTDALGHSTTTAYDFIGRVSSTTDANGRTTAFAYDAQNHRIRVTDASGGVVAYMYDENGNRLTVTDPNGNTTTHVYDVLNRLTKKTEPLGHVTAYAYDAVGNLIERTDPKGQVIQYSYDELDRRTGIDYATQPDVILNYDAVDNLVQMTDGLGKTTHTYDSRNRRTSTQDPFGNIVAYGYDANGNRTTLTYPGGKIVTYAYDEANRLTRVTDWLGHTTTYSYDAADRLIGTKNANGTTAAYGYDSADRLTSLSNRKSGGAVINQYAYTLDAVGNHLSEDRTEPLPLILPSASITDNHDVENRLIASNATPNTFDENGNLTAKGTNTYVYDVENRLIQTQIGGSITQYQYDGLGNRYAATRDGTTTRYVLDTNTPLTNVLMETTDTVSPLAYNVYGRGLISRILPNGSSLQFHYDSRGSTISMTNSAQRAVQQYAYDPFGRQVNAQGSAPNPFGYLGRYGVFDEGDELTYIRARYYDAGQQQFISKDPYLGEDRRTQTLNRYAYALNSPVRTIDITGFSPREVITLQPVNQGPTNSTPVGDRLLASTPLAGSDIVAVIEAEKARHDESMGILLAESLIDPGYEVLKEASLDFAISEIWLEIGLRSSNTIKVGALSEYFKATSRYASDALLIVSFAISAAEELDQQGLDLQDVGAGWSNALENLRFAKENPDAAYAAVESAYKVLLGAIGGKPIKKLTDRLQEAADPHFVSIGKRLRSVLESDASAYISVPGPLQNSNVISKGADLYLEGMALT